LPAAPRLAFALNRGSHGGRKPREWPPRVPRIGMGGVNLRSSGAIHRSLFGDLVLVAFLLAQAFDGVLTYVGVSTYGVRMEGNPLLGWLMATMGQGAALTAAKTTAGAFGIALHLTSVHRVVALLTAFYVAAAVLPWIGILYVWVS
jgi:Domain of unknown function (DUF5658)